MINGVFWPAKIMASPFIENGRGGGCNLMILILSISLNIWQDVASNFLWRWESSFPDIFSQNPAKIPCFYHFIAKNWFLLIFTYIFNASKFLSARWLYDITVTSYEVQWCTHFVWYQWIEEVHAYTLVWNVGVSGVSYRKFREGLQQPSPFGGRITKSTSGGRGSYICNILPQHESLEMHSLT